MFAEALRNTQFNDLNRSLNSVFVNGSSGRAAQFITRFLLRTGLQNKAFLSAFYVALPNAMLTLVIRILASEGMLPYVNPKVDGDDLITIPTGLWTSIVGGLSFLVVFRASQAYARFWQAITSVYLLQTEWLDACGSLCAFCSTSPAPENSVRNFKHLIVRLFSTYHAAALLRLVEPGIDDSAIAGITILDPGSLDSESTKAISESPHRLELVGQWIQICIMHAIHDKVVIAPPPIVSRCFQEIANGNVKLQDALKVKNIPFPPTYQLVCDLLLLVHFIATPFLTTLWVNSPIVAAMLAFVSVLVLWSPVFVARSIENPFCTKHFIHEAVFMQDDLNERLKTLLLPLAAQKPTMPLMTEAQAESSFIEEVTLDTFLSNQVQQESRCPSPSHLATQVTEASRVNFGSTSMPMQALMNTSDPSETRMSSRNRARKKSHLNDDGDIGVGSACKSGSPSSQGKALRDATEANDDGFAERSHDNPGMGGASMTAAMQISAVDHTGEVTVGMSTQHAAIETVNAQGNQHIRM